MAKPNPLSERQFQAASAVLDDQRRMIAAGKLQRWDVVKWAVTVNVALAAAAISFENSATGKQLVWLAVAVAVIGWILMLYYNLRLKRTRADALKTKENLGVNFEDTGSPPKSKDFFYDWQELLIFTIILAVSPAIVCLLSP
jgi:hypothetical protein